MAALRRKGMTMPVALVAPSLELHGFGFAFGERTIVRGIDLRLPERGALTLLGPAAAGKSSLLRLLSSEMGAAGNCQSWGNAVYCGAALGERGKPALAGQRARHVIGNVFETIAEELRGRARLLRAQQREIVAATLEGLGLKGLVARIDAPVIELSSLEQRMTALVRAWTTGSAVVCADEPTAGLDETSRGTMLALLQQIAAKRALLFVTHNLNDVSAINGEVALLAGGVIQEQGSAASFLKDPASDAGRQFVRTGSCPVPSPDAAEDEIDPPSQRGDPFRRAAPAQAAQGTVAIRWVIPGLLGGLSRPGFLYDLERDLASLAAAGIKVLLCLEERQTVAVDAIERHGMRPLWLPICDMRAPSMKVARWLCEWLDVKLSENEPVAVHCRGGLGRTGTILAALLIWRGASAPEALSAVRRVEPRFVQSAEQVEFLRRFAAVRRAGF